jgi:hypothetical protein
MCTGSGQHPVVDYRENNKEAMDSTKGSKVVDQLSDKQFIT